MATKAIFVTIPRAVVTSVYTSDSNGSQYIGLSSPAGEFKLSCAQGVHDFNQYLEADRMDFSLEITGRLFNNQQALQIQKVVNTGAKKPA
jgi:hypothetical protein